MGRSVLKKVCLLGDGAVGKTSLIRRFVLDSFDDKYIMTFGTKVSKKAMKFQSGDDDILLNILIWDILGQKHDSDLHAAYYQGAAGAFIVCDTTRKETFEHVAQWIQAFRRSCPDKPVILLGNKTDMIDKRIVTQAELSEAQVYHNLSDAFDTSAKTGKNVEEAFRAMGETILGLQ